MSASPESRGGEVLRDFNGESLSEVFEKGFVVVRNSISLDRCRALRFSFLFCRTRDTDMEPDHEYPNPNYATRYSIRGQTAGNQFVFPALMSLLRDTRDVVQAAGRKANIPSVSNWGGANTSKLVPTHYRRPQRYLSGQSIVYPKGHVMALHNDGPHVGDLVVIYNTKGRATVDIHEGEVAAARTDPAFPHHSVELEPMDCLVIAGHTTVPGAVSAPAHRVTNIGDGTRHSVAISSQVIS